MARRKPKEDPQNALLGDLESIRTLLQDDEDLEAGADTDPDDIEVPVLEDIVDPEGAVSEPDSAMESPPAEESDPDSQTESAPTSQPGLGDDLFKALLSDEWRNSASEVLRQAREAIDEHGSDWTLAETETLNDALKVQIDATMQGWMRGMLVTHMADLHQILLQALSEELRTTIDNIIQQRNETPDGE